MNEQFYDSIDAYLDNELSLGERKQFEQALTQDEELRQEVLFQKEFRRASSRVAEVDKIRAQIYQQAKESLSEPKPEPWYYAIRYVPIRWVAAASVLLVASWFAWTYWTNYSNQREMLAFYKQYKDTGILEDITLSPSSDSLSKLPVENALNDGYKLYSEKEYTKAIEKFGQAQEKIQGDRLRKILLYKGSAQVQLEQGQEAIRTLEQIPTPKDKDDIYYSSRWQLALAYLLTGEKASARNITEELATATQETNYKLVAPKLLKDLK